MQTPASCCNDTYRRGEDGVWRYGWGDPVPDARDLTLRQALRERDPGRYPQGRPMPPATAEDFDWARGLCGIDEPVEVRCPDGGRDLVVGLRAPELEVSVMLTVADLADVANVSKATVDSYRYRGYLPEPQFVKGRTPLWSRPVVLHWVAHRPGSGWRTDVYGDREGFQPRRTMPIQTARMARSRRRDTTARSG